MANDTRASLRGKQAAISMLEDLRAKSRGGSSAAELDRQLAKELERGLSGQDRHAFVTTLRRWACCSLDGATVSPTSL